MKNRIISKQSRKENPIINNMYSHPKISIIIPVYNAEKYLSVCLNSLLNQSYNNIEVLLINDGSSDRSKEICMEYESIDSRFRLFNKENGGVSSARNLGLKHATGEWIYFLDSDDWLELDTFEKLLLEGNNYDYIRHSFAEIFNEKTQEKIVRKITPLRKKEEYLYQIISRKTTLGVWGALYKSLIAKNLSFDENMSCGEDWLFLAQYLREVNRIKIINDPLYNYNRTNENSCTSKFSRKKYEDTLRSLNKIYQMLPEKAQSQKQTALFDIKYHFLFSLLKNNNDIFTWDDYHTVLNYNKFSKTKLIFTPIEKRKKIFLLLGSNKYIFKCMQKIYLFKHRQ